MQERKGEEKRGKRNEKRRREKERIKNKRRRDKRKKLDATIGNLTFLNINQKYHLPNSGLEKSGKRGGGLAQTKRIKRT